MQGWGLQLYLKRGCRTGVFCEFCEISKNTFSYGTPLVAACIYVHPSRSNDNAKKWWFGHNLNFLHKKMIRHKLLVCNSKWNVFLKICYPPSVQIFGLILKMRLQQSIKFWSFLNERDQTISRFCFVRSLYKYFSAGLQYLVGTAFFLHSYFPLLPMLSKSKYKLWKGVCIPVEVSYFCIDDVFHE